MDGNQNGTGNVETTYCTHCGTLNYKSNRFCTNCGATLNLESPKQQSTSQINQPPVPVQQPQQQPVTNTAPVEEKKPSKYKGLMIALAIVSLGLSSLDERIALIVFIAAIASLFNEDTKAYGATVFIAMGIGFLIGIILVIIFFGMCFAALGGM